MVPDGTLSQAAPGRFLSSSVISGFVTLCSSPRAWLHVSPSGTRHWAANFWTELLRGSLSPPCAFLSSPSQEADS